MSASSSLLRATMNQTSSVQENPYAVSRVLMPDSVAIVTVRKDLDRQISGTFRATRLKPVQARTGTHLAELIRARTAVITTDINKFRAVCRAREAIDRDENVFILIDESHRSQYGDEES